DTQDLEAMLGTERGGRGTGRTGTDNRDIDSCGKRGRHDLGCASMRRQSSSAKLLIASKSAAPSLPSVAQYRRINGPANSTTRSRSPAAGAIKRDCTSLVHSVRANSASADHTKYCSPGS